MTLYSISHGEYIDIKDSFSPSLKKSNILFIFDKIECERSLSFDIPDTPHNNRLFSNSKCINNRGAGMRQYYSAQLQDGFVVITGRLYVTEYSSGAYKAVFVTGELFGMKLLKEAGKVSDLIDTDITALWGNSPYLPYTARNETYSQIRYGTDKEQPLPSIRLHSVIEMAMQVLGVPVSLPAITQYVRIIPSELKALQETTVNFVSTASNMSETDHPICYTISINIIDTLLGVSYARVRRNLGPYVYMGRFEQYYTRQEIELQFPDDWSDDVYVGYFVDEDTNLLQEFSFYGDRSFDENGTTTGESLKGRSVTIPLGSKFVFIHKNSYVNRQTSSGLEIGWLPVGISVDLNISGGELSVGSTVRLQDNLPETDVVSLLKIVSALSGMQLYYEDGAGVSFVTGQRTKTFVLEKVIEQEDLNRTYWDYARSNVIRFDSEERMPDSAKLSLVYAVNNANLNVEKVLFTIPYSEGIPNGLYNDKQLLFTRSAALADANTNAAAMVRVTMSKNEVLESLCERSTSIKVRAKMTLLDFQRLSASTYIYYNYSNFMWTEANWSNGVATINLSMVQEVD